MPIAVNVAKELERGAFWRELEVERARLAQKLGADKVFDLTLENPPFEPPPDFARELEKLIAMPRPGLHRYMENAGYTDTRVAVAARLSAETGLPFTLNEIIMTSGASGALNMALKALLNPGEEVILFAPTAFDYPAYVANHSGAMKLVPCDTAFQPDLKAFEALLSPKTKAVLVNSPNNPSGAVYSQALLESLAEIINRRSAAFQTRIYVISDDSYRKFYYGAGKCPWIINAYAHTIVVSSYSKELPIPGERIGYTAISPRCEDARVVVGGLIHANRTLGFVNAPGLMQNAVRGLQNYKFNPAEFKERRDFLFSALTRLGYRVVKPEGAFYLLPAAPGSNDRAFVAKLKQFGVLAAPGSLFNAPGYFRLSYCVDRRVLEGSLTGFEKAR